jgi:hypothetical protein
VARDPEAADEAARLAVHQRAVWGRLQGMFQQAGCLLSFFGDADF